MSDFENLLDLIIIVLGFAIIAILLFKKSINVNAKPASYEKNLEIFKQGVEGASDHIVITDTEGIVLFANKSVERITGYGQEEIIGKKAGSKELWGGLMPKEFYKQLWKAIKVDKVPFSGEVTNKRKNGEVYTANATIIPILDRYGKILFFLGIERDITKEKEIDREKTEFVSLASHQLKTPLSSIKWYLEILLDKENTNLTKEQISYIKELDYENERLINTVNALLNVSRINEGTFFISPEKADLVKITKEIIAENKARIAEKNTTIIEKFDKNEIQLRIDKNLTKIVIENLVTNAIKYSGKNGIVELGIKYNPKTSLYGKGILITVKDNGIGIRNEDKSKIFTKLFRADNARQMVSDGIGLGLYSIKNIIEKAGGKIWFESEINHGSTFFVFLPESDMNKKFGTKAIN